LHAADAGGEGAHVLQLGREAQLDLRLVVPALADVDGGGGQEGGHLAEGEVADGLELLLQRVLLRLELGAHALDDQLDDLALGELGLDREGGGTDEGELVLRHFVGSSGWFIPTL
jgi:hypothetical protein